MNAMMYSISYIAMEKLKRPFFQNENGIMQSLLDHMIEKGGMVPAIFVSTSYIYGTPVNYYLDAAPYCKVLPQELVNDLIPFVKSRYRTHTLNTDLKGLQGSRNHLANIVCSSSSLENDFYIWACSGTDDVAYDRIWTQVQAMAKFTDVFDVNHLTFHEQEGVRHEFRAIAEYLYNVLPSLFSD